MMLKLTTFTVLTFLAVNCAMAEIYLCQTASGQWAFTDGQCDAGKPTAVQLSDSMERIPEAQQSASTKLDTAYQLQKERQKASTRPASPAQATKRPQTRPHPVSP